MLLEHQAVRLRISSLYAVLSLLVIIPMTVMSSVNFKMVFVAQTGRQSFMKSAYSRWVSTHPCCSPVFRVRVEDVYSPDLIFWGLLVRKFRVQLQMAGLRQRL